MRAARPSGRNSGMARHIAAKAAAPDSSLPFSVAWNRASSASRFSGQLV